MKFEISDETKDILNMNPDDMINLYNPINNNPRIEREKCVKCERQAVAICPKCGVLCRNHDAPHRHETGHITDELNWRFMDQPQVME